MCEEPVLYARQRGDILEVVTDRLTLRRADGALVAIEEHVLTLFRARNIRVMTLDEAPWQVAPHVLAPPLQRAA